MMSKPVSLPEGRLTSHESGSSGTLRSHEWILAYSVSRYFQYTMGLSASDSLSGS
jgi:hypothetical protein